MARDRAPSFRGREEKPSITLHSASLCQVFCKPSTDPGCEQTNSASPPPSLRSLKSAEAPQLRRPQVDEWGPKPAADIAFKVDAT